MSGKVQENKRILMLADWFDPAYKAGGPITSCVNFVKALGREFKIYVLTSNHDLDGSIIIGKNISSRWIQYDETVKVYYAESGELKISTINKIIAEINPTHVYCNSMFSLPFTIYPIILKRIGKIKAPLVLAPRGMLKPTALAFKSAKKKIFLAALNALGVSRILRLQATDKQELEDIRKVFGSSADVLQVSNFPGAVDSEIRFISKYPGSLRILFLGRIHPIKQLYYLLESLQFIDGDIELSVVGVEEDKEYLNDCVELIKLFPGKIEVSFLGEQPPSAVKEIIQNNHILALPTMGENFGHAIFESMGNGRPVVISINTPWRNLEEKKAGFDIDLRNKQAYVDALEFFLKMDQETYNDWSKNAHKLAKEFESNSDLKPQYHNLFSNGQS